MPMTYTDAIQAATIEAKISALIVAVVEIMTDNDEALDRRDPEKLERKNGFTVTMVAALSFYSSTGTGTPMLDSLISEAEDSQAAEWARQYPDRAPLYESDHPDVESWRDAALEGEDVFARVEIVREGDSVIFASCFTDVVKAPHGVEYRERMGVEPFIALDGDDLESLARRIADGPYLSVLTSENAAGLWKAWLGTSDGRTAYFSTYGHTSEQGARYAVDRAARNV
jgi:hypothetical protein